MTQAGGKMLRGHEYWDLMMCLLQSVNTVIRFHTEVTSGTGLLPEPVSHQSQEAIRDYLMAMTTWQLTGERATHTQWACTVPPAELFCTSHFAGFSYSVESCKSVVLSAALTEGHLTLQQAAELALLEQHFQVCPTSNAK